MIFGIKLLEMQDNLNGLLKPCAFLNIAAGICFATFILAPLGLLFGAGGDVMMGLILPSLGPHLHAVEVGGMPMKYCLIGTQPASHPGDQHTLRTVFPITEVRTD